MIYLFFLILLRAPRSTLFPYTTLFRSEEVRDLCFQSRLELSDLRVNVFDLLVIFQYVIHPTVEMWFRWERCFHHRSEEHTSELQSQSNLVCRLLLEKKKSTSFNLILGL